MITAKTYLQRNSAPMLGLLIGMAALAPLPAAAFGKIVYDPQAVAQIVKQLKQGKEQLDQLKGQLDEAKKLYGSLNQLTNMGDVGTILKDPAVRNALPKDFAEIEPLLSGKGGGTGAIGGLADKYFNENNGYEPPDVDAYYAKALNTAKKQNAGQMGMGEQIYQTATKRIEGIDELRQQIAKAGTAKETADLQARLQAETAMLQADQMRIQGVVMLQQAQLQARQQSADEDWHKKMDEARTNFQKGIKW